MPMLLSRNWALAKRRGERVEVGFLTEMDF